MFMRHGHRGSIGCHSNGSDERPSHHHHHSGRPHRRHHRGEHGRLFDYGELRLVLLALIGEEARHGYELIKLIEERSGGSYGPSPGVVYPTLSWLDDMGYVHIETADGTRKRYGMTEDGCSFLAANRPAADELLARLAASQGSGRGEVPSPVIRAMQNFKTAMRLRLKRGPLADATAEKIATLLDEAAKTAENS